VKRTPIISGCLFLAAVFAVCPTGWAALGSGADSIISDRKALHALPRATTSHAGYSVQEVQSDATAVREYLTPSGVVFGIAWNGHAYPDLAQLLGTYGAEYASARQKAERSFGRRRLRLATGNLVVEKWGHMRNLRGRAYVPSLVPAGVAIDAIK